MKVKQALISVSDKKGLDVLVRKLADLGIKILSTGGTAKYIRDLNIPVTDVSEYTKYPEMMNGRVKTLHPKIHGGLLALRENKEHVKQALENGIELIDMVVVNLYPFEDTISKPNVKLREAIDNIDIGGPSMLRSAAKNYKNVAVVTDPSDYNKIIDELERSKGDLSEKTLTELGVKVFKKTAEYDNTIYNYLSGKTELIDETAKENITLTLNKEVDLRYGENPHQKAAFYRDPASKTPGICALKQIQGKELSFNNIMDLNAALEIINEFNDPAVCIVKHTNPCGAAIGVSLEEAFINAIECDRLSAFGSIMGFNGRIDGKLAEVIMRESDFIECIIAPGFDEEAKAIFSVKKNLRIIEIPEQNMDSADEMDCKKVPGGMLIQEKDQYRIDTEDLKTVTKKNPTAEELKALLFSWTVVKHVKSNAIVFSNETKTVGIGAGQMSRVDSVIIASRKAGIRAKGAVMASDAFFPKADSIEQAHKAGITAVIQPGGSIRDAEVIEACDKLGVAMICTGKRHFKH